MLVPWGKATGKERHRVEKHEATVVESDWAQGAKPVQVKFGTNETAWVAATCVPCVEKSTEPNQGGEPNQEELALKAAQSYQNLQHNRTNEAPIGPGKVRDTNCPLIAL